MKHPYALLTALALLACVLTGCKTAGTQAETAAADTQTAAAQTESTAASATTQMTAEALCKTLTGLDYDTAVMTGDGITVPAGLYCYWQIYNASLMEYRVYTYAESSTEMKSLIGTSGYLNWDASFNGYDSLRAYLTKQTDDTVRFYMALEAVANENGVTLTEADEAQLETERRQIVESLGSEAEFDAYIAEMSLTREAYDRISADTCRLDKLVELEETEGSPLYVSDEEMDAYAMYTDHIYLTKIDLTGYDSLSDDEIAEKKAKAEALAAQLAAAEDPAALFATLADENSEDPYRSSYPDGYTYARGTMNTAYETAAAALKPGEVSGVVEGETGFYIILRKELAEKLKADPETRDDLCSDYLSDKLSARAAAMTVTVPEGVTLPDISAVYTAYVDRMTKAA